MKWGLNSNEQFADLLPAHLCPLRLLPFPLDYNFRISSRLSNFMFSTSIHTFWTSRFICFGLRFLYIRLRIRIIRLRLQKQSTSIEILLFVFLSATERHIIDLPVILLVLNINNNDTMTIDRDRTGSKGCAQR